MIIHGDCLAVMQQYPDNHFTSILTDPPYGLSFMNKAWDHSVPGIEFWVEALRVCKPGAMMLCFGGTRTYHRLTCAIEDAGWEIRDCLMWVYGSGFPKSHNKFGLEGYGTALKPAYEPIILAMKPLDGTYAHNVEKWGLGGINIDECRIQGQAWKPHSATGLAKNKFFTDGEASVIDKIPHVKGRWPANILFDEEAAELLDEQSGISKSKSGGMTFRNEGTKQLKGLGKTGRTGHDDSGGASRFFYCAKASSAERNRGLDCYLTVKYTQDTSRGTLCQEENMVAVQLLQKVIFESIPSCSIAASGENILVQFHQDFSSIIKTKTKQTIESKILNSLMHLLTNEYIQDANSLKENGGNLVASVRDLKKWILDITSGKMELAHGASNVALTMLSLISEEGNWKKGICSHPTVKPVVLLEYLLKLVAPPKNALILDPFAGSGSTCVAAKQLGIECVGIEISEEYCKIAQARIDSVKIDPQLDFFLP